MGTVQFVYLAKTLGIPLMGRAGHAIKSTDFVAISEALPKYDCQV